jgi:hypothetical protein
VRIDHRSVPLMNQGSEPLQRVLGHRREIS